MKKIIDRNYETSNFHNIETFEKYELDNHNPIYLCTCCGHSTTIDDSISNRGADLICGECAYRHYDGWANAMVYHCHTLRKEAIR